MPGGDVFPPKMRKEISRRKNKRLDEFLKPEEEPKKEARR
jgi:hypothetical protein